MSSDLSLSITDINEYIFEAEEKFDLLDIKINGVMIWQALRHYYYLKIAIELGIFTQPHSEDFSRSTRWKNLGRTLKSAVFNNPFFSRKNLDILILDHPRKVKVENEYIDIYTKYFIDDLLIQKQNFEVLEKPSQHRHLAKPSSYRKHAEIVQLLGSLSRPFISVSVDAKTEKQLKDAAVFLNNRLGMNLDLLTECSAFVKVFAGQKIWIDKLLTCKNPKQMYVVVGFAYAVWVQAAKEQGIEVIELQHGVMSRYHSGYSYPNPRPDSIVVFPDKLIVWNDYWKKMAPYPLSDKNIEVKKFQFFEYEKIKYAEVKKDPWKITVISQGTVTGGLAALLLKNSEVLKDYRICYKLHPGEFLRWKNYPALVEFAKLDNVEIVKDEYPLYELFASSSYLIGIYSTALFEGFEFGCKVLIADIAGIEHIQPMIDDKYFIKILNEDIPNSIRHSMVQTSHSQF